MIIANVFAKLALCDCDFDYEVTDLKIVNLIMGDSVAELDVTFLMEMTALPEDDTAWIRYADA